MSRAERAQSVLGGISSNRGSMLGPIRRGKGESQRAIQLLVDLARWVDDEAGLAISIVSLASPLSHRPKLQKQTSVRNARVTVVGTDLPRFPAGNGDVVSEIFGKHLGAVAAVE